MQFKELVFNVNRQLLKDDESSLFFTLLISTIQLMQMGYIFFSENIYLAWSHDLIAKPIGKVTGYFIPSSLLQYLSYGWMIVFLYIFVGLIAIYILLFIALHNKVSFTLPQQLLRLISHLMFTILYMPILDLFISIYTCPEGVHFQFKNQCWEGSHIVHAIVAIIFTAIFYIIAASSSLMIYEARFLYTNPISKQSGLDDFIVKTYIFIQIFNYLFNTQKYIYIIVVMIGLAVVYINSYLYNSYNNYYTYKYQQILIAINLWTGIMLTFSSILEDVIFLGSIIAWIIGVPLLVVIVLQNPDERLDLLFLDPQNASPNKILALNHHLLRIYKYGGVINTTIIDGYLRLQNKGNSLLKAVQQNYIDAIKRFPYEPMIRIRYAFFLLDFLDQRQQSLAEFTQAMVLEPTLDQEFIIYRYKKLVEDEMNDQNFMDVHNESLYQETIKTFTQKIERAALIHMDFWSQLQEDYPDLGRLNTIGLRIDDILNEIDQMWKKIVKLNYAGKAMRMYAKFMIDVLQDVQNGEQLFEKSRVVEANYVKNNSIISDEINLESFPTMIISLAPEKFGVIVNLNSACSSFIGYFKNELINRKINILIPNIFIKQHDQVMRNQENRLLRERQIFIKNKLNYIIPCTIEARTIQQEGASLVCAQFKPIRTYKTTCHILIDNDDIIDSISLSCINLLGLDNKYIQNKKLQITELFPRFHDTRMDFYQKQGAPFVHRPNEDFHRIQLGSNDMNEEFFQQDINLQAYITEIVFNKTVHGQSLKFELQEQEKLDFPKKLLSQNFQFKYMMGKQLIQGEYMNEQFSVMYDISAVIEQNDTASTHQQQSLNKQSDQEVNKDKEQKYDYGIKTIQLWQNRLQELDKDEQEEEVENEEQQSIFVNNIDNNEQKDGGNNSIFRSRQNLYEMIHSIDKVKIVSRLIIFSNIFGLLLVSLVFVEYFYMNKQFNDISNNIQLVQDENNAHSQIQMILTVVQNLKMLQYNVWRQQEIATDYEQQQKLILNNTLDTIQILNNKIQLNDLYITDQYNELRTQDVIAMHFYQGGVQYYDFMGATQQIISKAIEIANMNLSQIVQQNPSVYFLEYNVLNEYWLALRNVSNQMILSLRNRADGQQQFQIIIVALSASLLSIAIIVFVIGIIFINNLIIQSLIVFLDIPDKTIKYFYNKCENFISNLQLGEDEDTLSNYDDNDKDEQQELNKTLKSRKKKKKHINSNQKFKDYIVFYVICAMILESYFVLIYFSNQSYLQNLSQQIPELNVTLRTQALYILADNSQRQLFFNVSYKIITDDPYNAVKGNTLQMYTINSDMEQQHALNVGVQNSMYRTAYDAIMINNPCPIFASISQLPLDTCKAFARQAITQGMSIGISRYIENLRYIMTIYDQLWNLPKANFTTVSRGDVVFKRIVNDTVTNNILNLNNFNQTKESRNISMYYLPPTFQYLTTQFVLGLSQDIDSQKTLKLAVFIVYDIILFVLLFIIWWPFMLQLQRNIKKTWQLIIMIPIRIIVKIRSIKQHIKQLVNIPDQ